MNNYQKDDGNYASVVIMIDLLYHLSYLYKLLTNQITVMFFLLVTLVKMSKPNKPLIFHPLKISIDFFLVSFETTKYCIGESISLIIKNQSI